MSSNIFDMLDGTQPAPVPTNKNSFGICNINRTSPQRQDLSGNTKILNVEITFEEALKLNLAINASLQKLNSNRRAEHDRWQANSHELGNSPSKIGHYI